MAILEVKELSKYFGGLAALSAVDITINEGEIRGIIGPNGAGKTTLFNVISGIYQPTEGSVIYQGNDISGLSPHKIAERGVVRTFQQTALYNDFTVLKNVTVARHLYAKKGVFREIFGTAQQTREESEKKALELVKFMGLGHLKDKLAVDLPHGYQRALGIAIALAAEPKILMLDEPVTGMTPTEKQHMLQLIRRIHNQGVTILLVEHDISTVMGLCTYISVLDFGKKLAEGAPEEIQANKAVIEAYLGSEKIAT